MCSWWYSFSRKRMQTSQNDIRHVIAAQQRTIFTNIFIWPASTALLCPTLQPQNSVISTRWKGKKMKRRLYTLHNSWSSVGVRTKIGWRRYFVCYSVVHPNTHHHLWRDRRDETRTTQLRFILWRDRRFKVDTKRDALRPDVRESITYI